MSVVDTGGEADVTASVESAAAALGAEIVRFTRLISATKQRARREPDGGDRVILARLVMDGERRATDLAAETFLDLSTVSRQAHSLVDRGLVERRPDPDDRRGALLAATDAGRAAFEEYRRQRDAELASFLRAWPKTDRCELVRLMGRLNDDLTERHVAQSPAGGAPYTTAEQGEEQA
jgi:DNA-binding MarR family transcriptional regulator